MKIFFKPSMMNQLNKAIKDALDHNKVIDFIQLTQEEFDQLALEMSALNWKPDPENPGQFKYQGVPLIVEPIVSLGVMNV